MPGGRLVLLARHGKGWRPRAEKTRLTPEHPGTAVRWEEQLFEVLDADAAEAGGVRYTLALWDDRHVIRVAETYDLASEGRHQKEFEKHARREHQRWVALIAAPLLGCLPAKVQEDIENEIAIPATRMTLFSCVPLLLFGAFSLLAMLIVMFGGPALLPMPVFLVGLYFWFESLCRLATAMAQDRPVGLLPAELIWDVWRSLRKRREKELSGPSGEARPPELVARDSFLLIEPLLSFLDERDQARLRELFGFDGVIWGRVTAIVILVAFGPMFVASVLGALMVPEPRDIVLLAFSGTLVIEQASRLRKLARGQVAPSVLRFLVRPFAGRLLGPSRP